MKVFVGIFEAGSLTAAAFNAGRSLPSTVRILANLEAHFGVKLLNRTTRQIALTEEGNTYLIHSRNVLADIENMEIALGQNQGTPSGTVSISSSAKFGHLHVFPAVKTYLAQFPQLSIHLTLNNKILDLLEGRIDFAVRIGHLKDSSLVAKKVGEIRHLIVASPELIKKTGQPNKPTDLQTMPCITYLDGALETTWSFKVGAEKQKIGVKGTFASNDVDASIEACCAGLGYGRYFSYQVLPYIEKGLLQVVLVDYVQPVIPISIVYPTARLIPHRTRHAIDWFHNTLSADIYL
jgi:DNA-binding transcriptional LysR family regulator